MLLAFTLLALAAEPTPALFRKDDHVAWIGSSSTRIGVWPRTAEFLLSTRHPELNLRFTRLTSGGGTFATARQLLGPALEKYKPTVVLFNYGGNDANGGEKGLATFRENIKASLDLVTASGARPILMTHQALDPRKNEPFAAARKLYAENLLMYAADLGVPSVDVFHPLEKLQAAGSAENASFTVLADHIHLTRPAYVAWGWFLYQRLGLPDVESRATLTAAGTITEAKGCEIGNVQVTKDGLSFIRADDVLPILPPVEVLPETLVPMVAGSRYLLTITDLPAGTYELRCEDQPLGTATAEMLAKGVNLNELARAPGQAAPWAKVATEWWEGRGRDQIGRTKWRFEVRRK